jgi:hypothetical protein
MQGFEPFMSSQTFQEFMVRYAHCRSHLLEAALQSHTCCSDLVNRMELERAW